MVKKYRHYKGAMYEFVCIAIHSETDEKLVVYKNEEGTSFARPYDMFFEEVEVEGKTIPRFQEV
ncbi:DUF1653 domain-containing protein [Fictibacillus sp. FJAT-27399]|uniref:DUF1653 domain-containing protein n=1 Tax=Fictibacillus sp. FJAT-27399 TaxID=1729689 RepID=UPI000AD944E2|nr:DUF1653 domain-containing protein [Fictibacillus sp. FJAT-27399]